MEHHIISLSEIKIIGKTTGTNLAQEMSASAKIGPLITEYFTQGLAERIPNRKNKGISFSIYTDYESDYTGNYSYYFGEEVDSFENTPQGLFALTIPAQRYVRFTTKPGPMPAVVIDAWQHIWRMTPEELGGKRAYIADFEIYDERAADPQNTVADIYVGIY